MKKEITITNINNKNCFLYLRVSTKRQAEFGYSLEAQLKSCTEYAQRLGFTIKDTFVEEGESGTIAERTEFQKMLNRCEDGEVGAIVVINTDRFARSEIDHFLIKDKLKKLGVRLYSVLQPMVSEDTPEAQLMDTMMAGVNAFYSRDNSRKTKKGMREKFEQGWWPQQSPIGYKNITEDGTGKRIIGIDPVLAPLVEESFRLFASGRYSIHTLCVKMAKRGLKGKSGKPIGESTFHILLTNTFYYGWMKWADLERTGNHEPLIDKPLFDKVEYLLSKHRSFVIRERKFDFLLRGAVICQNHNRRLVGEWHKINSTKRDKISYYHCSARGGCKGTYVDAELLEKKVENLFKRIHFTDEFIAQVTNQAKLHLSNLQNSYKEKKKIIDNRIKALEQKRDNIEDNLADKTISKEAFQRMHGKTQSEIDAAYQQIIDLESDREVDVNFIQEIFFLANNIHETYKLASNTLKRGYLKLFFEGIYVADKGIAKTIYNPLFATLIKEQKVILRQNKLPDI